MRAATSFGVGYGLYNMAWGVGLLGGPALGGFLFERLGFAALTLSAGRPSLLLVTLAAGRGYNSDPRPGEERPYELVSRIVTIVPLSLPSLSSRLPLASLRADVRADQKTHVQFAGMLGRMVNMFGGKAAREGVTSSVAVKGDRKATMNDTTGQIIDLSEEKVYDLDLKKKTYKVTTFAELRRRMEEAQKKAEEDAQKEQGKAQPPAGRPEREADGDRLRHQEHRREEDHQRLRHARGGR